jgi:hypothetical protein
MKTALTVFCRLSERQMLTGAAPKQLRPQGKPFKVSNLDGMYA